ncbi:MAG: phospholipase, partial [Planctomycetota bacterium]
MSDATLPLIFVEREPQSLTETPPLLVLLHGFGASEHDLIGLADELPSELHVVSARAPIDLADAGMPGGYAWFNLIFRPDGIAYDEDSAEEGAALARAFVRAAQERANASPERTFILGFSQGAMMAHSILLEEPELIAGAACCSGRA